MNKFYVVFVSLSIFTSAFPINSNPNKEVALIDLIISSSQKLKEKLSEDQKIMVLNYIASFKTLIKRSIDLFTEYSQKELDPHRKNQIDNEMAPLVNDFMAQTDILNQLTQKDPQIKIYVDEILGNSWYFLASTGNKIDQKMYELALELVLEVERQLS